MRQLLDLKELWASYPHFFVTEDTALGRSISRDQATEFVAHVALGQSRLGRPHVMLWQALVNLWQSLRIVMKHRPDVVITTGAGSMAFTALWARIFGAHIILIDSFARFDSPSAFARLVGPIAHLRIAQSAAVAARWPGALLFDPFRILDRQRPEKSPVVFATVGATLKFDRLVALVANAKKVGLLPEHIILQVGEGGALPDGAIEDVECHETLPFDQIGDILRRADIVVCHGGTGSLITAMREGCRIIAVPRRFDRGEHYDDHQSEITEAFAKRGLLEVANTDEEFAVALARLRGREPGCATTDPQALTAYLEGHLAKIAAQ